MSESLPIAFAVYPILLSGIAIVWLFSFRYRSWPNWTVRLSACGSIIAFAFIAVLGALAIASHYPTGKTLDVTFPLSAGTYYVLQGGASAVANPFHALGGSKLAIDIVKLNSRGNRANGIAPLELSAYSIFGEKLFTLMQQETAEKLGLVFGDGRCRSSVIFRK
jgi:hypothetical protein